MRHRAHPMTAVRLAEKAVNAASAVAGVAVVVTSVDIIIESPFTIDSIGPPVTLMTVKTPDACGGRRQENAMSPSRDVTACVTTENYAWARGAPARLGFAYC